MIASLVLLAATLTGAPPTSCRPAAEGKLLCVVDGKEVLIYTAPSWWPTQPSPYQPQPGEPCPRFRARSGDKSITCPEDTQR